MTPTLAGLHDIESGDLTKRIDHVGMVCEVSGRDSGDGSADLRLRCGHSGCGDDDGLTHPFRFQNYILFDGIERAAIEGFGADLAEGCSSSEDVELAGGSAAELITAVIVARSAENDRAVLDEGYVSVGHRAAYSIGDDSVNGDGVGGGCENKGAGE